LQAAQTRAWQAQQHHNVIKALKAGTASTLTVGNSWHQVNNWAIALNSATESVKGERFGTTPQNKSNRMQTGWLVVIVEFKAIVHY